MIRMLNRNKISGLLPFQEKQVNGDVMFYYDITSKQPLDRILEKRSLTAEEFRRLISDFIFALRQMERFLMDEGQLCLKPEYIYVEPDAFHGSFCLIPGKHGDFTTEFCELAQYLLDHVSHSDGEAVVLAFSVFRECRKGNFGIDDIERCIGEIGEKGAGSEDTAVEKIEKSENEELQEKEQNDYVIYEESESRWKKAAVIGMISGMIAVPVILYLLMGMGTFLLWSKKILICEFLFAVILGVVLKTNEATDREQGNDVKKLSGELESEEDLWKVYFKEMDNYEETEWQTGTEKNQNVDSEEGNMKTVLLTESPVHKEMRCLVPMDGGSEISIGYYPFLIGKNKDLSDFRLNEEGVSRLHVKIEKTENGYSVTDLNSTNGTRVNGELLEANETRELPLGSELTIATARYRFR